MVSISWESEHGFAGCLWLKVSWSFSQAVGWGCGLIRWLMGTRGLCLSSLTLLSSGLLPHNMGLFIGLSDDMRTSSPREIWEWERESTHHFCHVQLEVNQEIQLTPKGKGLYKDVNTKAGITGGHLRGCLSQVFSTVYEMHTYPLPTS